MRYHGGMRILFLAPIILLAACSSEERSAGGVTPNEARALEDAAEMLQDQRLPAGSVPTAPAPAAVAKPPAKPSAKPAG